MLAEEELRRVIPVVEALAAAGALVSIDTSKSQVAARAIDAGAVIVNDVTALGRSRHGGRREQASRSAWS